MTLATTMLKYTYITQTAYVECPLDSGKNF